VSATRAELPGLVDVDAGAGRQRRATSRDLGLERLELRITVENAGSMRVAEWAGFVREGVLRSLHLKQGLRSDVAVYSRLRSDGAGAPT